MSRPAAGTSAKAAPAKKASARKATTTRVDTAPARTRPPTRAGATRPTAGRNSGRRRLGLTPTEWAITLLLVSPAVIVPGGLDRFVFGKLLIAAVGIGVAALVPAAGRLPRLVQGLLAGSALLLALSAALSSTPQASFFGRQPLSEGVLVLAVYLLAGISGARLLGPGRTARTVTVALGAMAVCALLVGLLAVLESAGLRPLSSDADRPGSLLGNASDEGAFAVLYAGPLLAEAVRRARPLVVAGAVAAILTVVLSASRGALLAVVAMLLILAVASSRRTRLAAGVTVLISAGLAFVIPATRQRVLGDSPLSAHTANGRNLLWRETLDVFGHHPWFGVGPSAFENAIVGEHTRQWQQQVGPADPPGSPHNWILQALVIGGPLLLLALGALILLLLRGARRAVAAGQNDWALATSAGLAGYGVALLFHFPSPSTAIPAALLAGSLLATQPSPVRGAAERSLQIGTGVLAGALAVVFVLAAGSEIALRGAEDDLAAGHLSRADSAFDTARDLRPWDVDLPGQAMHGFVAQVSVGNKAAIPFARRWERRVGPAGNDEQLAQNRAALAQASGDYRGALTILDRQLRRDPFDPQLLLLRGVTRAQTNDLSGAVSDLREVTRIDRDDPKAWHDLALIYRAQGQTTLATTAERQATKLSN